MNNFYCGGYLHFSCQLHVVFMSTSRLYSVDFGTLSRRFFGTEVPYVVLSGRVKLLQSKWTSLRRLRRNYHMNTTHLTTVRLQRSWMLLKIWERFFEVTVSRIHLIRCASGTNFHCSWNSPLCCIRIQLSSFLCLIYLRIIFWTF